MVNEADKEGLEIGDDVVILTGINSMENNTRVYGVVINTEMENRLTITVISTVIE